MMTDDAIMLQFSTDDIAAADRIGLWREVYARNLLNVDPEAVGDGPFRSAFTLQTFDSVGVVAGRCSGAVFRRTPDLVDSDDLLLMIHLGAAGGAAQRRRETSLRAGDATLLAGADVGRSIHPEGVEFLNLRLPLGAMTALNGGIEDALVMPLRRENPAVSLLTHYVHMVARPGLAKSPDLGASISRHICDLAALAVGAGPGTREAARESVGGARLLGIKADIRRHMTWTGISIGWAAARHGVSPGYVRKLFASQQSTFSDFLLGERLSAARRRLEDPRLSGRTISSIAYDCGFGDLSYFNRCFRRQYGATPSDIRSLAHESRR